MKNKTIAELTIGDFISNKKLVSALETATLRDVHMIMVANGISHIPLVSPEGVPLGVLGEREVRSFYLAPDFNTILANTVMSTKFLTFPSQAKLSDVTREMVSKNQCVVVIASQDKNPLGIFTVSDALEALDYVLQNHLKS